MFLSLFFEHIKKTKNLPEGSIFCFFGREYPLLFFNHLISFLKKSGLSITPINCCNVDSTEIKALLSTISFQGQIIYWLDGFYILSIKKQQELFDYICSYTGPHKILLFYSQGIKESITSAITGMHKIDLPKKITYHDFLSLRFLISDAIQESTPFGSRLSLYSDNLSLDSACLFAHYEAVIGKNVEDFFAQWITRIIEPTHSLFVLSQHFFAKKSQLFFRQWSIIEKSYLPPFWATFWADQMWRAYVFCDLMKQKNHDAAKGAQYKLPFSFINRDWSRYSLSELRNAHHFLADMDFRLKNGGSEIGLEYFYIQFFENKFR